MSNTARIQAQRKVAREMGQLLRRAKELGMGDLEEQFVPRKYARLNAWNEAVARLRRAIEERESDLQAQLAAAVRRIVELEASRGVEPDWHISPTWAQYWAVDADGAAYWYEVEPNAKGAMGYWGKGAGRCELDPIRRSFSWLDTLRRRQTQEGAEG